MIITALCDSYKSEILAGVHGVDDEYRVALYSEEASLGRFTERYTPAGEAEGEGYEAGGIALSGAVVRSVSGKACLTFGDALWPRVTIVAAGGMIYNASKDGRAVAVFSFGGEVEARNGRFPLEIPADLIGIK